MCVIEIKTVPLLASAYVGVPDHYLTHAVLTADGRPCSVMCDDVRLASLCDSSLWTDDEPTCEVCLARWLKSKTKFCKSCRTTKELGQFAKKRGKRMARCHSCLDDLRRKRIRIGGQQIYQAATDPRTRGIPRFTLRYPPLR